MDWLLNLFEDKIMFYGIIAAITFIIIAIFLIKKAMKNDNEDEIVSIEKIDGQDSVFDEIIEEKVKTNSDQLDLDSMIAKMQKDIESKASDVVEKFEQEQEDKSIISYSELIGNKESKQLALDIIENDHNSETETNEENVINTDVSHSLNVLNEIEKDFEEETAHSYDDFDAQNNIDISFESPIEESLNDMTVEEPSIISASPVISKLNMQEEFAHALKTGDYEEIIEKKEETPKFKATKFISPIYGVQNIKMQYPTVQNMKENRNVQNYNKFELEQTLNMEKISKEISKDEDFLNSLKDFRKNLE